MPCSRDKIFANCYFRSKAQKGELKNVDSLKLLSITRYFHYLCDNRTCPNLQFKYCDHIQNVCYSLCCFSVNNTHVCCFQRYLKALGMSRTAQVKKDARIGEAEARRDATIRVTNFVLNRLNFANFVLIQ